MSVFQEIAHVRDLQNMEYIHHYDSPLGGITMAGDGRALTGYAGGLDRKALLPEMEMRNSL